MIKMKVTDNYSLDVLDIVTSGFNGVWKSVFVGVFNSRKDIRNRCRPMLCFIQLRNNDSLKEGDKPVLDPQHIPSHTE
jgi:hypothetical protein